jgi:hypothetical protein
VELLAAMQWLGCGSPPVVQVQEYSESEDSDMTTLGERQLRRLGSKIGWSQSGELITKNTSQIVSLQANFEFPEYYTVQFGVSSAVVKSRALITWGVEGNTITRLVSVANGVEVSGAGQSCNVRVVDISDGVIASGVHYTVFIDVVKGTRAFTGQPPTLAVYSATGGVFSVGPLSSTSIPIPLDAGVISVFVTVSTIAGSSAVIAENDIQVAQQTGGTTQKTYDPRDFPEFVPITPGADVVTIFNNNAAQTYQVSVTFGIDG